MAPLRASVKDAVEASVAAAAEAAVENVARLPEPVAEVAEREAGARAAAAAALGAAPRGQGGPVLVQCDSVPVQDGPVTVHHRVSHISTAAVRHPETGMVFQWGR